nr:vegetative incompatibility protein het-e-1 [Quercus suber]
MNTGKTSRKRDTFRNLFSKGYHASSVQAATSSVHGPSSGASQTQNSVAQDPGATFLRKSMSLLKPKERETIEKYALHGVADINIAVARAHSAALDHKQTCTDRLWRWSLLGRTVVLRDEADKVLRWLDRFKAVGLIVPTADFRQVSGAESRQMTALLVGMDLAMCTASRLQVYFDYFTRLPSTLEADNLERALIKMYVHLLQLIALAIQTYEDGLAARVVQAVWRTSSIEDFETECDKLAQRAEVEASNCGRAMDERNWEDARRWRDDLTSILKGIDHIQAISDALTRVNIKVDLARLASAPGATYNSHVEEGLAHCLPGTRVSLLDQVANWADDANGKCIFWLCGKAGTGKSTISRTIAYRLDQQLRLGASFFFKRGEGDRALEKDSFLSSRGLQDQFEKLLSQPLASLTQIQGRPPSRTFLVIDALDECEPDASIKMLLSLLPRLEVVTSLRLRIFVTSRPQLPIKRSGLKMRLNNLTSHSMDWPKGEEINAVVRLAIPLFIFAFTVCRYIAESDPRGRLEAILQRGQDVSLSGLEKTYLPILDQLIADDQGAVHRQDRTIADFKELVGSIILLATPLAAPSLSRLLEVPMRAIGDRLSKLHSVLDIPAERDAPIRLFHLSFHDFLVDTEARDSNRFWINKSETHGMLARKCLLLLSKPGILQKDLCGAEEPGIQRHEISQQTIARSIPPDTAYACSYWVWHLAEYKKAIVQDGEEHMFLKTHFLHWMEALSWLGRLSDIFDHISKLRSLVRVSKGAKRSPFPTASRMLTISY